MTVEEADTTMFTVRRKCPLCAGAAELAVSTVGYVAWTGGQLIQDVFPDLSAGDREILISGTHPECWDELMAEYDDEMRPLEGES